MMKVHPAAEAFPLMTSAELKTLADDIKMSGLQQAIVTTTGMSDGVVIDGRNRWMACEQAGVRPRFQKFTGKDARAYILTANLQWRNLTEGQKAIAAAIIYPNAEQTWPGKKTKIHFNLKCIDPARLVAARKIVKHSEALAFAVRDGERSFASALNIVSLETTEPKRKYERKESKTQKPKSDKSGTTTGAEPAGVAEAETEPDSGAKVKAESKSKPDTDHFMIWGDLCDWEKKYIVQDPQKRAGFMMEAERVDALRIIPILIAWLKEFEEALREIEKSKSKKCSKAIRS